jgi:hypothetical protein
VTLIRRFRPVLLSVVALTGCMDVQDLPKELRVIGDAAQMHAALEKWISRGDERTETIARLERIGFHCDTIPAGIRLAEITRRRLRETVCNVQIFSPANRLWRVKIVDSVGRVARFSTAQLPIPHDSMLTKP